TKAALRGKNDIREYYEYLLQNGYSCEHAQNKITRYIAKVSYAKKILLFCVLIYVNKIQL
ncbi:MAG: hypothetical protein M3R36_12770, partial [Bacteroidota bacterium]|nr:hypothetical protein [Bacteroidota bacterium]